MTSANTQVEVTGSKQVIESASRPVGRPMTPLGCSTVSSSSHRMPSHAIARWSQRLAFRQGEQAAQ
jgi:hypothetical protein